MKPNRGFSQALRDVQCEKINWGFGATCYCIIGEPFLDDTTDPYRGNWTAWGFHHMLFCTSEFLCKCITCFLKMKFKYVNVNEWALTAFPSLSTSGV